MKSTNIIVLLSLSLVIIFASTAYSSPTLSIGDADILPGGKTNLSIQLNNNSQSCAGVNMQILLPQGVNLQTIEKGDLLSDNFQIYWQAFDSDANKYVNIIAYANDDAITKTNGNLFDLVLTVDEQLCRHIPIRFSENSNNPKVNVSHAISNNDGSESIDHNVISGLLRLENFIFGDLNCDKMIKLEDAMIVLKNMCGLLNDTTDMSNIGLEEAIYIMNIVSN
jgi:hypothetical protein